jgi:hypothetical protein
MTDTNPFQEIQQHAGDLKIAPAHGIASIALHLALKYHDINTVQDGALYQQYKLEGKNMRELHLDHVFETATRMERWLLASSDRIAQVIVEALEVRVDEEEEPDAGEDQERGETDQR